jgi:UDP-N-acetylglucosamine acyltransferase
MTHQSRIHPTAVISAEAEIADDVTIGPYTVIEGPVHIGAGTVIGPHVHLLGPLTMGTGNRIHTGAVIADSAQHLRCDVKGGVVIGNNNVIREHVTIHSATQADHPTTIGDHNFLMAHSHVAHDCTVGNHCILTNGALLGGHCVMEDSVYLSGNTAMHQFCRVGRLALLCGLSVVTKDIPCFSMVQGFNTIVNLNIVGMRRAGMTNEQIETMRKVYRILFREGRPVSASVELVERAFGHLPEIAELLVFIRGSKRGIVAHTPKAA